MFKEVEEAGWVRGTSNNRLICEEWMEKVEENRLMGGRNGGMRGMKGIERRKEWRNEGMKR